MVSKLFVGLVRLYQLTISPFLGNHCRFYPSCSAYCIEAIEKHGVLKGFLLTTKRLSKCHPLCEGGIDHVPEPKSTKA